MSPSIDHPSLPLSLSLSIPNTEIRFESFVRPFLSITIHGDEGSGTKDDQFVEEEMLTAD